MCVCVCVCLFTPNVKSTVDFTKIHLRRTVLFISGTSNFQAHVCLRHKVILGSRYKLYDFRLLLQEHIPRDIPNQKFHKEHLSNSHLLWNYGYLKFKNAHKPFKAQWLLYVPPGLTFSNSTFCQQCVFMWFVWISDPYRIVIMSGTTDNITAK
jgi:hypothetical protein